MRNSETKRFGGREIEDKLEFGRLLDRYIAGLGSTQNLVDQLAGAPEQIQVIWSVGHESTGLDMLAAIEDGREPRAERQRDYARAVGGNKWIADDVKCVRWGLERLEGVGDIRTRHRSGSNYHTGGGQV